MGLRDFRGWNKKYLYPEQTGTSSNIRINHKCSTSTAEHLKDVPTLNQRKPIPTLGCSGVPAKSPIWGSPAYLLLTAKPYRRNIMQDESVHTLFERLDAFGVNLTVLDGKLEWETSLPLPESLLRELIERQGEFVAMTTGVLDNGEPICLLPKPIPGGKRIPAKDVEEILGLLEDFGTTLKLVGPAISLTGSKPLPSKVVGILHKYTDDIYAHLAKELNNRRRN